jgi:hypothetical protein
MEGVGEREFYTNISQGEGNLEGQKRGINQTEFYREGTDYWT